jgi:predicted nuclease of restriction endonuclease-like RecB superfamily
VKQKKRKLAPVEKVKKAHKLVRNLGKILEEMVRFHQASVSHSLAAVDGVA